MSIARTPKEWDITICAYLKSVIESGAPSNEWEHLARTALRLHLTLHDLAMKPTKETTHE
jgi:hypothetical protein